MLVTARNSRTRVATSLSLLLLASNSLPQIGRGVAAVAAARQPHQHRFSHHKAGLNIPASSATAAEAAGKNGNTTTTTSSTRNASYASGGSSGWDSSVDNPFKMDRPVNVFGRPLAQCGTNPMTGFYRDGVRTKPFMDIVLCMFSD